MADITNNPFIDHSSSVTSRFPSLTERNDSQSPPAHPQYTSWLQGQSSGPSHSNPHQGYAASNPTGYGGVQGYQQQQPTGFGAAQYGAQQTGYGQAPTSPTASGFRPSSNFGQQMSMMSQPGYSAGYAQQQPQQPQQPQYTGYPQAQTQTGYGGYGQGGYGQQQQQAQQPTPYGGNPTLAAFDPYSTLSSPNVQLGSSAPTSSASSAAPGASGAGGYRADHPRAFIQAHKAELEQWDAVTWKQALNSFDALKGAWDTRKREVEARVKVMGGTVGSAGGFFGGAQAGYGGYGGYDYGQQWQQQQQAQEFERLNALYKEAESNVDSVAASYFQMNEVFTGYRHSGDLASKRRVRESSNAALTNLPDWPPQTF